VAGKGDDRNTLGTGGWRTTWSRGEKVAMLVFLLGIGMLASGQVLVAYGVWTQAWRLRSSGSYLALSGVCSAFVFHTWRTGSLITCRPVVFDRTFRVVDRHSYPITYWSYMVVASCSALGFVALSFYQWLC